MTTSNNYSSKGTSSVAARHAALRRFGWMAGALMVGAVISNVAQADVKVTLHQVSQQGVVDEIGQVTVSESEHGLVFTPNLKGLSPGLHGFHVHENPSCEPQETDGKVTAAGAAGGHYDPDGSKKHGSPWGDGHLGDLPALYVDAEGNAQLPVLAPRLTKLDQLNGRALMVHEGGDNYSDHPMPLGGGGGRMACGVVE